MGFFDGAFGGIIGGIGSIIGGSMAADATRDAAQMQVEDAGRNRAFDQTNLNQGMARQLAMLLGGERAYQMLSGTMGREQLQQLFRNPAQETRWNDLKTQLESTQATLAKYATGFRWRDDPANPGRRVQVAKGFDTKRARADGVDLKAIQNQQKELFTTLQNERSNIPQDALDLEGFKGIQGSLGGYDTLARDAEQQGRDAMDQYDQATNTLTREMDTSRDTVMRDMDSSRDTVMRDMNASLEETSRFGDKRRELINRNMDDARTGNNRMIQSSLLARGLGNSTVLGNQLTGATEQLENARQQQLASVDDAQIAMMNQLRGNRTSMLANMLGNRSATMADMLNNRNTLSNNRATGRTQMTLGNQDRVMNYRAQPINLQTQLLSSGMTNPWAGRSTQQYFPGINPGAQAQMSWANTIGNMSGMMLGNYLGGRNNGGGQASSPSPYSTYQPPGPALGRWSNYGPGPNG